MHWGGLHDFIHYPNASVQQKYFKGPLFNCQAASSAIESNSAATGRNFDPLLHVQNTHVTV